MLVQAINPLYNELVVANTKVITDIFPCIVPKYCLDLFFHFLLFLLYNFTLSLSGGVDFFKKITFFRFFEIFMILLKPEPKKN